MHTAILVRANILAISVLNCMVKLLTLVDE
jgi:hypothetical protein